ncbi:conserved hypothetical protein [Thermosulfidibacter takaii ABI70S6]|uniref:tRNA(Ile)-lysidine/2-thiocytidine synthase N-terminal domain-containing protein n=1 Tax=Thermosulfidibacter takaii (strain DSM 17441 / JCM 13301 / NBRC 103674 / ABI70S6) TaxID=1298851 RepID=A0A0S3QVQ0_THET7|nr:ATP-binding protein [Thermosulfidibacter takaii]BAT72391.1 conserved hypothetical protein [Thermosulfidibacter takaii ABI70S6]
MKCERCHEAAEAFIPSKGRSFCRKHFVEYFEETVLDTIKQFSMFTHEDEVVVAVSGGKDSLALLYLLNKLGYRAWGYHIDLGIGEYSRISTEKVVAFSKQFGIEVVVETVVGELGYGIDELSKLVSRKPCSLCGMVKRYMMNRAAKGKIIATGHNLDDEAASLVSNILGWRVGYIGRQYPVLEARESLSKKVKPFVFVSELETSMYAFFEGIDYVVQECPLAHGATSIQYKKMLNMIEEKYPNTKLKFLEGFFRLKLTMNTEEELHLRPCNICSYLTTAGVCSFCRLKQRVIDPKFAHPL